jgi:hypothetical protein
MTERHSPLLRKEVERTLDAIVEFGVILRFYKKPVLIPKPAGSRLAVLAAVAAPGLAPALVGVPLALGVAGYLTISLSKPNRIVRGRSLSVTQHRRAAIIVGSVVFGIAALFSATLAGFDLSAKLEAELYDSIGLSGESNSRASENRPVRRHSDVKFGVLSRQRSVDVRSRLTSVGHRTRSASPGQSPFPRPMD